jgi:hypothetical protein
MQNPYGSKYNIPVNYDETYLFARVSTVEEDARIKLRGVKVVKCHNWLISILTET